MPARLRGLAAALAAASTLAAVLLAQSVAAPRLQHVDSADVLPAPERLARVRAYIARTWDTLTRTLADLPAAARDPKLHLPPDTPWPVYIPRTENRARLEQRVAESLGANRARVRIDVLPDDRSSIGTHGLLYLPRPYVVPGGRFNEMYGWDSYFIQVGLLHDGKVDLARDLVDNFVYQIEHYGTILNANRTYYLTRSQPPFLTRMILGVYERTRDRAWLESVWPAVEAHYAYWVQPAHLAGETRLSRYFDSGSGPAPEVVSDEVDAQGRTHYDRVREYYRTHDVAAYDLSLYFDARTAQLTPLFYVGDRSMRESGFDPSDRFGPFSVDIIHHAPVCLNSLLYVMERDGATIATILGDGAAADRWTERAVRRQALASRYLWDEQAGLFFDYDTRAGSRRLYPFATTFYPLWAGMATEAQARRVRDNLAMFERPGGTITSTTTSGSQWDAPFGWAPLQMMAVDGLRRYGYHEDADRLARRFVALVTKEFDEHGVIVEKYDVVRRESDVSAGIRYGYSGNEVGFGWTNGVVLHLLEGLAGR